MNSTRCSRLVAFLAVVALLTSAVAPAAAVSVKTDGVPEDAKVGNEVSGTMTLSDLYGDYERWTLNGTTELRDVTWTVTTYDQAGNQKAKKSYDGQSFDHELALDSGVSKVDVKVTGTVPEVENFTYDPQQSFTFAELHQTRDGGNTDAIDQPATVNYHTEASREARSAIADAESAIDDAASGADTKEAESGVEDAISAYNGGNFELAGDLADKATKNANSASENAKSSAQQTKLLMYGGAAVLGLVAIGGGGYWYRSQQGPENKLR